MTSQPQSGDHVAGSKDVRGDQVQGDKVGGDKFDTMQSMLMAKLIELAESNARIEAGLVADKEDKKKALQRFAIHEIVLIVQSILLIWLVIEVAIG